MRLLPPQHPPAIVVVLCVWLLILSFSLLVEAADRDPVAVPNPDCGGEGEPRCKITEYGLFAKFWDYGFPLTTQKTAGCDIGLVSNLDSGDPRCVNATSDVPVAHGRRTSAPDDFKDTWTAWALEQQFFLGLAEPFNWVARLATHNSFNSKFGGAPLVPIDLVNQKYSLTDQLEFGVRRLELDTHWFPNSLKVCHGKGEDDGHLGCALTDRPYYMAIKEIRDWLGAHPNAFIFIVLEDSSEDHFDEVIWPIEYYLGDAVLRTDDAVPNSSLDAYTFFWENRRRAPSFREIVNLNVALALQGKPSKQVMFLEKGDSTIQEWGWSNTVTSGSGSKAKDFVADPDFATCSVNSIQMTPPVLDSNGDIPFLGNNPGPVLSSGKFRRVYEARSILDPLDPAGYLNREEKGDDPEELELQALVRDVANCNITPAFDYILAQEETPESEFFFGLEALACADGADCSAPDNRLKDVVWSWKENDQGENGDYALYDSSDGRWTSAPMTEEHHFACADPRTSLIEPSDWPDIPGSRWMVTSAVGTWDQGLETCLEEFGSLPVGGASSGDYLPFAVPVNGWQNGRLKVALEEAVQRLSFIANSQNVWLNYWKRDSGDWRVGEQPVAMLDDIQVLRELNFGPIPLLQFITKDQISEGEAIDFRIENILPDPSLVPLNRLFWKVSPGFVTNFQGTGTTFETDLTSGGFPRGITFAFGDSDLHGQEQWTVEVALDGDLSALTPRLSKTLLDYKNIQFTLTNVPPRINGPTDKFLSQGDLIQTAAGNVFNASYSFTDPGGQDDGPFTCTVTYGDGSPAITVNTGDNQVAGHTCRYALPNNLGHQYMQLGTYEVVLSVTDKDGDTKVHTFNVVNNTDAVPPSIKGGCESQTLRLGETFACSPFFEDPNETDTFTASVDFDDGVMETDLAIQSVNPIHHFVIIQHTYTEPGTYEVVLTVNDNAPATPSDTRTYTVVVEEEPLSKEPPTFRAETQGPPGGFEPGLQFSQITGEEGVPITRTFLLEDPNPTHSFWRVAINWDTADPDGRRDEVRFMTVSRANGLSFPQSVPFKATFTYPEGGNFLVTIGGWENSDGDGLINNDATLSIPHSFLASVDGNNAAPILDGVNTEPLVLNEGETVNLPNQSFTDSDVTDSWVASVNWGDGTSELLTLTGQAFVLDHQYLESRLVPYSATVIINDGTVTTQASFSVRVNNVAPIVNVGAEVAINEGEVYTDNGFFTDLGADSWTATVDYGDGSDVQQLALTADKNFALSHLYRDSGNYPVTVTVTDDDGGIGVSTTTVSVKNVVPLLSIGGDSSVSEGSLYKLNIGVVSDPGIDTVTECTVQWGDGASSLCIPGESFTHTYVDGENAYTISIDLTDEDGDYPSVASHEVIVNNVAPTVLLRADRTLFENDNFSLDSSSFTDPGVLDTHTAMINWGDATSDPGVIDPNVRSISGMHRYGIPGRYTVTVIVEDKDGGAGSDIMLLKVLPGIFKACISADKLGGDLKIEKDAHINCSVHSEGKVTLKKNGVVDGDVTARSKEIKLEKDSTVNGHVASDDKVKLEKDARVQGDVTSGDNIVLEKDSRVGGDVTAAGKVKLKKGATVGGNILEIAAVLPVSSITLVDLNVSAGGVDVTVDKNNTMNLVPGNYGKLDIKKSATVTFTAGAYAFKKIEVDKNATLNFTLGGGEVIIDVVGKVKLDKQVVMTVSDGDASDILFRVNGDSVKVGNDGVILGTFVAPYADFKIEKDAQVTGALYGNEIQLKQNVSVTGAPAITLLNDLFLP